MVSGLARPLHRRGGREGGARGRRRHGRARLHRQGERPGPVRGRRSACSRPTWRSSRRSATRASRARRRSRLAAEWGIPIAAIATLVLDRREPVGPDRRVRPARGSVGRAARGRVRPDGSRRRIVRREPAEIAVAFERGRPRGARRRRTAIPARDPRARRARRLVRVRAGRHDREPPGRASSRRELYEVPGALAHHPGAPALEDLTLEREVAHHKPRSSSAGPTWSTTASGSPAARRRSTRTSTRRRRT